MKCAAASAIFPRKGDERPAVGIRFHTNTASKKQIPTHGTNEYQGCERNLRRVIQMFRRGASRPRVYTAINKTRGATDTRPRN
mmetsp:Transcript_16891/g.38602  ORF Transcript_16891/g.38602 Transcript_16891/m.38602 type:complete len:83 (+) Transcript_16891:594-842(+)